MPVVTVGTISSCPDADDENSGHPDDEYTLFVCGSHWPRYIRVVDSELLGTPTHPRRDQNTDDMSLRWGSTMIILEVQGYKI